MGRGSSEDQAASAQHAPDDASETPRSWPMFAGRKMEQGLLLHVESHPRTVKAYGDDPVPVAAIEDPDGSYYGWIDASEPERGPQLVQPHRSLFAMQFPYGPKAEVEAGRGSVVKLRIEDAPAAE